MWGWRCRFSLALQEPEITTYPVPLTSPVIIGDTAGATFCASIQEPGRPDRKHFPKEDFHIDLEAGSCTCPAGNVTRRIRPLGTRTAATGRTHQLKAFQFDGAVCGVCPLRTQCVAGSSGLGRRAQLHSQEALLQQVRALQQSEACWRVPAAPGGGGAPVGAAGPTGNPPVPLLRPRQDDIPVVPVPWRPRWPT